MQVAQTIDDFCASTTTGTAAYVACVEAAMRDLAGAGASASPTAGLSETQARATVVRLLARLTVPDPSISLGPDPAVNEWNMAVVGYPLWLWTSESDTRSTSISEAGYTITMRARRDRVTFDMGDGSAPIVCGSTTPYPGTSIGMVPSPSCGHTYERRPAGGSTYTVTARAHWTVTWSFATYNGTLTLNTAAQRTIKVGELQSIVVANR